MIYNVSMGTLNPTIPYLLYRIPAVAIGNDDSTIIIIIINPFWVGK